MYKIAVQFVQDILDYEEYGELMGSDSGLTGKRIDDLDGAVALAVSAVAERYGIKPDRIVDLEAKHEDYGEEWHVVLEWEGKRIIVSMDAINGIVSAITKI